MKTEQLRELITAKIIKALQDGVKPWTAGWDRQASLSRPLRHNGTPYRGINVLMLWMVAADRGFESPYWMTYKQAQSLGGQVRKGSKSTAVLVYKSLDPKEEGAPSDAGETPAGRRIFSRAYNVFNADQIDGLDAPYVNAPPPEPRAHDALAAYDALMEVHAPQYEVGPQPCYVPARDMVRWPEVGTFHSPEDHLATTCHELAHWSGAGHRLARDGVAKPYNKLRYSYEELVAELSAAFMGGTFGIVGHQIDDHAAYIDHWIQLLDEPTIIFKAAAEAEKACNFLITQPVLDALDRRSLPLAA